MKNNNLINDETISVELILLADRDHPVVYARRLLVYGYRRSGQSANNSRPTHFTTILSHRLSSLSGGIKTTDHDRVQAESLEVLFTQVFSDQLEIKKIDDTKFLIRDRNLQSRRRGRQNPHRESSRSRPGSYF